MSRKRLQHSADTFCHMFCGWRLANSYKDLARLGSGTLEIDVLVGSCRFDGVAIEPLNIAGELHCWLCEDLAAHGIPIDSLLRGSLTAHLSITAVGLRPRSTPVQFFGADGKPIRSGEFYRCEIECESEVVAEGAVYRSRSKDIEEWPMGWPDA
ncbi:MAG: hypothetical protein P4L85_09495 [Paludisphaera borealis]|uniref:hypothetical protein n=1 Tax=Paludisphaera borealis TaxID=1387353 RepID=UPI00283DD59F|nr:hypothetical protein [Paludisphaera borealis]MDR3619572.1 hypothetical protein [Paludisphaera borealis]